MSEEERQALAAVLEYLSEEREHYAALRTAREDVSGHIYRDVVKLKLYLRRRAHQVERARGVDRTLELTA